MCPYIPVDAIKALYMDTLTLSPARQQEFDDLIDTKIEKDPYIISISNHNGSPQQVSLFNDRYYNDHITLESATPDVSYHEICKRFSQPVNLGLLLVKILEPVKPEDILEFLVFKFCKKDGRGNKNFQPIAMCENPGELERVLFQQIDITTGPLTYLNFMIPTGAWIEIQLFEKKAPVKLPS